VTPIIPLFDPDEVARHLAEQLAQHREAFGGRLGQPAEGPMFRTAGDGSIIGPGGVVVAPPPPPSPTAGAR